MGARHPDLLASGAVHAERMARLTQKVNANLKTG
jgi:hypothetical protein